MFRKINFIFLLFCALAVHAAKPVILPQSVTCIAFYGVDFTQVSLISTDESDDYFIRAFKGINRLFSTEMRKYNIEEATGLNVSEYDFDMVNDMNAGIDVSKARKMKPTYLTEQELADHIASLPVTGTGTGLIIVAENLDKNRCRGGYHFVFFDRETRAIVDSSYIEGKPGGAGLRNFWASSVRKAMYSLLIKNQ